MSSSSRSPGVFARGRNHPSMVMPWVGRTQSVTAVRGVARLMASISFRHVVFWIRGGSPATGNAVVPYHSGDAIPGTGKDLQ